MLSEPLFGSHDIIPATKHLCDLSGLCGERRGSASFSRRPRMNAKLVRSTSVLYLPAKAFAGKLAEGVDE